MISEDKIFEYKKASEEQGICTPADRTVNVVSYEVKMLRFVLE